MKAKKFSIAGLLELRPGKFEDERGEFIETFKSSKFKELWITEEFLQDNQSVSKKGVFWSPYLAIEEQNIILFTLWLIAAEKIETEAK